MDDAIDEESVRLKPASTGAALIVAGLSLAILYNALMGQPSALAELPEIAGGVVKLEVDAGEAKGAVVSVRFDSIVEAVQRELAATGFYTGPVDGVAGKRTREAIEAWQRLNGLTVTGEATQELADHIAFNRTVAEAAGATGSLETAPADDRIAQVQTGLSELGYLPGAADGRLGQQTRDAIRQFERDRGLGESGEISDALLAELAKTSGQSALAAD